MTLTKTLQKFVDAGVMSAQDAEFLCAATARKKRKSSCMVKGCKERGLSRDYPCWYHSEEKAKNPRRFWHTVRYGDHERILQTRRKKKKFESY